MEKRAYFFGNMYLSSIQQGIQAAHVIGEMMVKYIPHRLGLIDEWNMDQTFQLISWANDHKTVVLLNAGYAEEIFILTQFFNDHRNPYPWAGFQEEEAALGSAHTSAGIILPQKIYEGARIIREWRPSKSGAYNLSPRDTLENEGQIVIGPENVYNINVEELTTWEYNGFERKLVQRLNNYGLAR